MKRPIYLGLIGAGRWGRAYINTINSLRGVELKRLYSSNPKSASLVGSRCQVTDNWRALIDVDDIDGVIIATPPALHKEMVEAAVLAGLPAMVEKPLTMNLSEALHLQEMVEHTGVPVLVDHTQLFHPGYVMLKNKVEKLGPVRIIRSLGGNWGPFRPDAPLL